jgi:GAF domain-containing protein
MDFHQNTPKPPDDRANHQANHQANRQINHQDYHHSVKRVADRLSKIIERDTLVDQAITRLRNYLQVDRVVLYYFYSQWRGQVTLESLSAEEFSILGSTGADDCFNAEYAELYLAGRVRAMANIEVEPLHPCHQEFLRGMQVKANLVVPVLTKKGLWGLLVAHHCRSTHFWTKDEIILMQEIAKTLAEAPSICQS